MLNNQVHQSKRYKFNNPQLSGFAYFLNETIPKFVLLGRHFWNWAASTGKSLRRYCTCRCHKERVERYCIAVNNLDNSTDELPDNHLRWRYMTDQHQLSILN